MAEPILTVIGFDADDTLWQNEFFFRQTEDRYLDLLADFGDVNLTQNQTDGDDADSQEDLNGQGSPGADGGLDHGA